MLRRRHASICAGPWCSVMVPSCSVKEHLDIVCRNAPQSCQHCTVEVSRAHLAAHRLNECQGYTVICYSCRETVVYKDLAEHMERHIASYAKPADCCPLAIDGCQFLSTDKATSSIGAHMGQCPFWTTACTGCGAVVKRQDLPQHICSTIPNGEWAWEMPGAEGVFLTVAHQSMHQMHYPDYPDALPARAAAADAGGSAAAAAVTAKLADERKEDAEALATDFIKRHPKLLPVAYSMTWVK